MKIFDYKKEKSFIEDFLKKAQSVDKSVLKAVEEIIAMTKKDGDLALIELSNKFDKANFSCADDFIVSQNEIDKAVKNIAPELLEALKQAYSRIFSYHKKQMPQDFIYDDEIGVKLGNLWRALDKVGVYAPGGTASYPSSVLMAAVPALVAGVGEIVLCAPTSAGKISDAVLVAAQICGIKKIYKVGGAQAISALACGTESIEKVDKIVGPGNSYIACAKKIFYGEVGIDMIAGPTDLTIVCDDDNNPDFIAADALSQLEHGIDSQVFIITDSKNFADKILSSIAKLSNDLARKNIIEKSLQNSAIIIVEDLNIAPEIVNKIAPEHLEISCEFADKFVAQIKNAGAIFVGKYTPESVGDYIAGPSHVLPTSGTARFASGLSVYDFLKRISLISCDEKSFSKLAKHTEILAESEGLGAHKLSVSIRK